MALLACSQSSMVKLPSGRSAMICKVDPLIFTRTRRKPRPSSTGSTSFATRNAGPVSRVSLCSVISGNKNGGPRIGTHPHNSSYVSEPKLTFI